MNELLRATEKRRGEFLRTASEAFTFQEVREFIQSQNVPQSSAPDMNAHLFIYYRQGVRHKVLSWHSGIHSLLLLGGLPILLFLLLSCLHQPSHCDLSLAFIGLHGSASSGTRDAGFDVSA